MNKRARLTLLCTLATVGACSTTTPVGVVPTAGTEGGTPTGAGGTTGAAGTGAAGTGAAGVGSAGTTSYVPAGDQVVQDPPFVNPAGISGDWVGYLENYRNYYPGSDELRFHFGTDAQGNGTITVVQGRGAPPVPPTDSFQAWPVPFVDAAGSPIEGVEFPDMPIAGFVYKARHVTWQGKRLKFLRLSAEPWSTWCGLQTSYPPPPAVDGGALLPWTCNAGTNATRAEDGTCTYPDAPNARCTINHEYLCGGFLCGCNATGCGANTSSKVPFDVTFLGGYAVGSMDNYNLILMPATP